MRGLPASTQASGASQTQAGIWITLVGAILTVSALEHLTTLRWFVTYPLALAAGLLITVGYIGLKKAFLRKWSQ